MKHMIIALCLLTLTFTLSAQDETPKYQLRVPSGYEATQTMFAIIEQTEQATEPEPRILSQVSTALLQQPNLYEADLDTLLQIYEVVKTTDDVDSPHFDWLRVFLQHWLYKEHPDLNIVQEYQFADLYITAMHHDLNGDGVDEHILDVSKGGIADRNSCGSCSCNVETAQYFVVQQTADTYTVVPHPIVRWIGGWGHGGIQHLDFIDVNQDGLDEWLVLQGGSTWGMAGQGYQNTGELLILGWRNDGLVNLAKVTDPELNHTVTHYGEDAGVCAFASPRDVKWEFENIDDDPALEILQRQYNLDNWYCESDTVQVLDWDDSESQYVLSNVVKEFPNETRNCLQRMAEESMWAGDYLQAIDYFEQALQKQPFEYPEGHPLADVNYRLCEELYKLDQYLLTRLALAYILTNQPQKASETLSNTGAIGEINLAAQLQNYVDDPLLACATAYDVFSREMSKVDRIYGVTREKLFPGIPTYSPARIGCPAEVMIESALETYHYATDEMPLDLIEALNLPVYRSITADFDGDGENEWLIWLDLMMPPFFFDRVDDGYVFTRPNIDPYLRGQEAVLWTLPDNRPAIVIFHLQPFRYDLVTPLWLLTYDPSGGFGGYRYQCEDGDSAHEMQIWAVEDQHLASVFSERVCYGNLDRIFPAGEGTTILEAGSMSVTQFSTKDLVFEIRQYAWDSTTGEYVLQTTGNWLDVRTTQIPNADNITPQSDSWWDLVYQAQNTFRKHQSLHVFVDNFEITLTEGFYKAEGQTYLQAQYWYGLALEALNRPDEALAEYIAIYEAAPESAWGMLAALHIEEVDE